MLAIKMLVWTCKIAVHISGEQHIHKLGITFLVSWQIEQAHPKDFVALFELHACSQSYVRGNNNAAHTLRMAVVQDCNV